MRLGYLSLSVPLVLLVGCASNNEMKRPFMFKEAKLPGRISCAGPRGRDHRQGVSGVSNGADPREVKAGSIGGPNVMFRPLFNHIKRNDIPMTAPVEMGYPEHVEPSEGASSMAFLYGEPSWGTSGADAADQRVVVEDVSAMTVVSIGVRGGYTDANFEKAISKLNAWVQQRADEVRVVGPPRFLAYNSPFVLGFLKYGEVQLPLEIVGNADEENAP